MAFRFRTTAFIVFGALALGAIANRAALRAPLDIDDFGQRAMIEGTLTPKRNAFDLYDFVADDNRAALIERGVLPWWSDPRLVTRFLRPLPSALVWVDHRVFGYDPFGPHLLSFFWWAAAVLTGCVFYRTTLEKRAALFATITFALSPTHAIPILWLANRNILVTLTFGAAALALYARWRSDKQRGLALATAAAFTATAFTGEYALCLCGYLVAFELCLRAESARNRLIGALPAAAPFVLYLAAHAALGYGATASGFYRDPISETGAYIRALPRSLSTLVAASWLGIDVTSPLLRSDAVHVVLILGAIAGAIGAVRYARGTSADRNGLNGSWLACGSVLALLPLTVTEPSRRLLGVAALGVSGAVGVFFNEAARRAQSPLRRSVAVGIAALAALIHLAGAPPSTRALSLGAVEDQTLMLARFNAIAHQSHDLNTTVVVRANYGPTVLSAPFILRDNAPKRWRVLSHTFDQTTVIRTSPTSVEVAQENVPLFPIGATGLVRTIPFRVGDVVDIPGMRATVLRVDEQGRPMAVRYEFDRDLDGSDVAWIAEGRPGFSIIDPRPPIGIGMRLPP